MIDFAKLRKSESLMNAHLYWYLPNDKIDTVVWIDMVDMVDLQNRTYKNTNKRITKQNKLTKTRSILF